MRTKFSILLLLFSASLFSSPITINNTADYAILDRFFRTMVEEELFGYVLEGEKPLSAFNIYPSDSLINPNSPFFQWEILSREAIEVWNRLAPSQNRYAFKVTQAFNHNFGGLYQELLFINRAQVQTVIEKNIDLFRFHLGPTLECDVLTDLIVGSSLSLDQIIKSNNALMGILLGYGTYNSLMGGRFEEIIGAHGDLDYPPYCGYHLQRKNSNNLQSYLLAYTDTEVTVSKIAQKLSLYPCIGNHNLEEEAAKITALSERVPTKILNEKPTFIFGAYKSEENQLFFKKIRSTQIEVQKLLSRSDFLEHILEKITGEKPIIACPLPNGSNLPIGKHSEEAVALVVWQMAQSLDEEAISIFIDSLSNFQTCKEDKSQAALIPGVLYGLKQAKANLATAEKQLSSWLDSQQIREIVPKHLFYETVLPGHGDPIGSSTDLLLSYVIEDCLGHTLGASYRCWTDLSNTFLGFAHGVKGMRKGETRLIYVHPSYGYGATTSLPPCVSLKVKVTLHEVNDHIQKKLSPPCPIDLDWVNDPEFYDKIVKDTQETASYLGKLWGEWLSTSNDLDFSMLCSKLKKFSNACIPPQSLDQKSMKRNCDRVFWNLMKEE